MPSVPEPASPSVDLPVEVPLPSGDGRCVTVRIGVPGDAAALERLYARLPVEDRYRRFFSGAVPTRTFLDGWLGPDGLVVVAELDGELVGEAGCARDRAGVAQLGIAVDPAHRGWLGPYLLDVLLRLAGARGVPSVVADVLATNRSMLALLAARGYAVLPSDDLGVVRVLLGTGDAVPSWPPGGARRVLVELGRGRSVLADALAAEGYDVVTCRGPASAPARRWRCPVLHGRRCPLVDGADAVVVAGDPAGGDAQVLEAVRREHDGVALCVLADPSDAEHAVEAVRGLLDA